MLPRGAWLLFILMLGLIAVVYYIGTATDLLAGAKVLQILGFTYTGRNGQGVFQKYPNTNTQVYSPTF